MVSSILLTPILISLLITMFLLPYWIKKAKQINLVWDDMNKLTSEKIAGSGGIAVILGFTAGVFVYISYRTFYLGTTNSFLIEIFALLVSILFLAGIGLIDDLFGWQQGGLSVKSRMLLVILAAVPLIAINAGKSKVLLPFLGPTELGVIYPLVLIPIGMLGATTVFNFLAGFNGLEAGQGIILLSSLSIVSFLTGNTWLSLILLCMVASLLAFLLFNFCPAKVFPGDILTYPVGGLIAIVSILGNFEKIAVFFFIPYIIEFILKARGRFKKQSFGLPKSNSSLDLRYSKIYSLNHVSISLMKKLGVKPTEKKVVYSIWIFQIILILIGFLIFREGIFI